MSTSEQDTPTPRSRRRRRFIIGGVIVTAVVGLLVAGPALARGLGFGHGHGAMDAIKTPEQALTHLRKGADRVLDRLDATDAQRAQIDALLVPLATDFLNLKNESQALKKAMHEALRPDPPNRARVEQLRKEGVALIDRATKVGLDALQDAAEVLTPEQRAKVREHIERMHKHRRGH